ncbi:DMT family transporter [Nonomuraea ferruginea]
MPAFTLDDPVDRGLPRPGNLLRTAADSIPPSGLVLLAIFSVQLGAGFAKQLFTALPPSAVVFLRIAMGALIIGAVARPRLKGMAWRDWAVGIGFGVTLALMNLTFYEALARLPMGGRGRHRVPRPAGRGGGRLPAAARPGLGGAGRDRSGAARALGRVGVGELGGHRVRAGGGRLLGGLHPAVGGGREPVPRHDRAGVRDGGLGRGRRAGGGSSPAGPTCSSPSC